MKEQKLFQHQASDREVREQQWHLHCLRGEGIPLPGGLVSSTCKVLLLFFKTRLPVLAVPRSQPTSLLLPQHSVTPEVIEESCPGEATGTTRSPVLSQHVDAVPQVHLVQRLY